jgi:hypothetical protein
MISFLFLSNSLKTPLSTPSPLPVPIRFEILAAEMKFYARGGGKKKTPIQCITTNTCLKLFKSGDHTKQEDPGSSNEIPQSFFLAEWIGIPFKKLHHLSIFRL